VLRLLWEQSAKRWQEGYNETWLVKIIFNLGQALASQLSVHHLLSWDDLHVRLQVQDTAVCLGKRTAQQNSQENSSHT